MTKEELLELVNKKEDTSKFKSLSQRTIDEELVEALEEIGDDESANDKVVTKLANRLKRMNGNLHSNVAAEVKKAKEEAERKKKEEEEIEIYNEEFKKMKIFKKNNIYGLALAKPKAKWKIQRLLWNCGD